MSRYSRTVRCRHCYKEGHNVKSCETLTNDVKNDVDGRAHRRYSKYFNDDGTRKKDSSIKKCSYCDLPGHTKRTCGTKLNDMIANNKTNAEYRRDMYNFLKEKGLGIGSLVTIHRNMFLVIGIEWDNFSCGDNRWDLSHLQILSVDGSSLYKKFCIDEYIIKYDRKSIKVESPEHDIPEPSSEWFSGKSEYYKDFKGLVSNPFRFEPSRF